jgi:nitroreductase
MDAHKKASPDHPVNALIAERWSPYSFAEKAVSGDDVRSIFEAARWAASSYNEQPWSYIVATRANDEAFERLLSCLVEGNRPWAQAAPVLAIGCTSLKFAANGQPNAAAHHDLGLASATLTIEATARGLSVHQMIGILPDRARELYNIPEGVEPLTALAIGYRGEPDALPESYRPRDLAPRRRKPVGEFVFGDKWGTTSSLVGG